MLTAMVVISTAACMAGLPPPCLPSVAYTCITRTHRVLLWHQNFRLHVCKTSATDENRGASSIMDMLLSDAEREYIEGGAAAGVRSDGRSQLDLRPITLETMILPTASGSARVRIGHVTDILVGIKPEVVETIGEAPDEGRLNFSVDVSNLASPDFVGRGAADLNASLAQMLHRLYASRAARRLRQGLCVIEGRRCWVLHVDALVLDSGGNLFGALSMAVRAALRVTRLPRVVVVEGEADEDDDVSVDEGHWHDVPYAEEAPVAITVAALGSGHVVDCTSEEELCARRSITVGVNLRGNACGAVSAGSGSVDMDTLSVMLKDAVTVGLQVITSTDKFLEEDVEKRCKGHIPQLVGFFS